MDWGSKIMRESNLRLLIQPNDRFFFECKKIVKKERKGENGMYMQ